MHFIINFEISLVNFLNVLGFLLLTSEKNGDDTFSICYFLVINIYCFFDDHDAGLLLLEFFVVCLSVRFLKGCLKAILQVPLSLTRKLRKTTHTHAHTHQTVFLWKNMGKVFLKPLFFAIQFWNKTWILFLQIVPIWRNSWNFTLQKRILQKDKSS